MKYGLCLKDLRLLGSCRPLGGLGVSGLESDFGLRVWG